MSHIFISYSTKNADYAYRLAERLQDEGFNVWIDNAQLRSSDNWWESIVVALRQCAAFIIVMTPESRESKWVQREVTLADNWGKPLFPVLLDGENWEIFVLTQYQDVRNRRLPPQQFFQKLAEYAPPQQQGENVTERTSVDSVRMDTAVRQEIANPPEREESQKTTGKTATSSNLAQRRSFIAKTFLNRLNEPWAVIIAAVISGIFLITGTLIQRNIEASTTPTPDVPRTPTALAQLDITATEAMLQRTVDARETENALLLAQNTEIAAQTQTAAAPTITPEAQTALEVTIEPLIVQPGERVTVHTEGGATCVFIPSVGSVSEPVTTSGGTILWIADYEPGITVRVSCTKDNITNDSMTFRVASNATNTPVPPNAANTPVQASANTLALTIYRDEDSFTLYVPQSSAQVSLVGLEFRVTLLDGTTVARRLDQDYAAFLGLPFGNLDTLGQAVCFRLVRNGGTHSVPQDCQPPAALLLTQQIAVADMFWQNRSIGVDHTVLVYRGDQLMGACGPQASCQVNWQNE